MDNDDLNALMTIGSSVWKSNEHGIEGGWAIRVCGRRHSTLWLGSQPPFGDLVGAWVVGLLPNVLAGMEHMFLRYFRSGQDVLHNKHASCRIHDGEGFILMKQG